MSSYYSLKRLLHPVSVLLCILFMCNTNTYSIPNQLDNQSYASISGSYSHYSGLLDKRITVSVNNKTLQYLLDQISILGDIDLVYENELVDKTVTRFKADSMEIGEILKAIQDEYEIGYTVLSDKVIIASHASLQDKTGRVKGKVTDTKGEILPGANVVISENKYGTACSHKGMYVIRNLTPGQYTVKASFIGYEPQVVTVTVSPGKTTELNFKLKPSSFQIGGIEVTGKQELLPTEVNSKTEIRSGEIEHFQATHIGDVLDLVPGIQKTNNPGIGKTSKVAIRGESEDNLSAFGTKVIIDGTPQSNNVNLQFEALVGSKFGGSTMGSSVDLRTIPADNLENIEVITGLPSVKYGDFTSGIINIRTKIGSRPHRLKVKTNPRNNEANLGGGFKVTDESALSYNLNVARSTRDIRIDGDEYTRYTGQLAYSSILMNSVKNNIKVNVQAVNDEEEPEQLFDLTNNYNRGFELSLSDWGETIIEGETNKIEYSTYLRMKKINSRKSKLITSDLRILPNGDSVTSYIGVVRNKGMEWSTGGRLDWNNVFFTGSYIHKFLAGAEYSYEANTGDGILIDSLFNYYGPDSKRRSYSYDDIPAYNILSLYAEDKVTGHLLLDFSFMFGFRYEMYNPEKFNFGGLYGDGNIVESKQGTFFNPRASMMIYLSKNNQIRLSAGKVSKAPPLSTLYKPEDVLTWRNPYSKDLRYTTIDLWQPDLEGYSETQYEVGYDHKFFGWLGLSLTGYYKERVNELEYPDIPVFIETDAGETNEIFYVGEYRLGQNGGSSLRKGFEFSLRTNKIKSINTTFMVNGAYSYRNDPGNVMLYDNNPDESLGQYENYIVNTSFGDQLYGWTYLSSGNWREKFQLNYYIQYTHPDLGLWITLRAEQLYTDQTKTYNLVPMDESLISPEKLASRNIERSVKSKPNKWLFNFSISKSLFAGAEVSFYVNNFLDDPAVYSYYSNYNTKTYSTRNPDLYYGVEFSMIFDKILE